MWVEVLYGEDARRLADKQTRTAVLWACTTPASSLIGRVAAISCTKPHHGTNGFADVVIVNTTIELSGVEPLPLLLDVMLQLVCRQICK